MAINHDVHIVDLDSVEWNGINMGTKRLVFVIGGVFVYHRVPSCTIVYYLVHSLCYTMVWTLFVVHNDIQTLVIILEEYIFELLPVYGTCPKTRIFS